MWIGGLMGLIVVFSITFAQPKIGATATIGILIAGQLVMGAVIDRYGLFGVDQIALTWPRLLGIALLAAGAALSLVR
jgi:transporter family-2 protein